MQYIKAKSAAKIILPKGEGLTKTILDTCSTIAKIVGGTLGPGGHPVLIERDDPNLPPLITKDGVTVFRNLGFQNAVAHTIFEATKDVAIRTANEAGDGTTTATILYEAFVRYTTQYCSRNPNVAPIRVVKEVQNVLYDKINPLIEKLKINCTLHTKEGKDLLRGVARVSGNGDTALADAVIECFEICGDEGNVTINEATGDHKYDVKKIEGFPIASGYEVSCSRFYPIFINDQGTQKVVYDKPLFLLYFGRLTDINTIVPILEKVQDGWKGEYLQSWKLVVVATGFSDSVLVNFASITSNANHIDIFPLVVPMDSPVANAQRHFLDDLAAVVGAEVFDPMTKPLDTAKLEDLGNCLAEEVEQGEDIVIKYKCLGVKAFEATRYRSSVIGHCDEGLLIDRIDEVSKALDGAESEYELIYTRERLAKLSDGIAELKVIGSSNGEIKERRDRAEDAICAVRGAIKHGALVGGGWTIGKIILDLNRSVLEKMGDARSEVVTRNEFKNTIITDVVIPSMGEVLRVLYENAGYPFPPNDDYDALVNYIKKQHSNGGGSSQLSEYMIFDLSKNEKVDGLKNCLLDSLPALKEALKNAVSIATVLGTTNGCVVYPRDIQAELNEARDQADYRRAVNSVDEKL